MERIFIQVFLNLLIEIIEKLKWLSNCLDSFLIAKSFLKLFTVRYKLRNIHLTPKSAFQIIHKSPREH